VNSPLDKISEAHQEEFAKLKAGRRQTTYLFIFLLTALFVISFAASSVPSASKAREGLERARQEMRARGNDWADTLSEEQSSYALWLKNHGLEIERRIYTQAGHFVFWSVTQVTGAADNSFLSSLLITLHSSLLRVAFILIACWRIWIVGAIIAAIYAARNWKGYFGRDILGQMGTGQFFYSGLKADLSKVSATGAPEKQVTGLACPQLSSETEGDLSALGKTIKKWGVANQTNRMLVRILVAYKEWPAYVSEIDGEAVFNRFFSGANLPQHAAEVLDRLLTLQKEYQEGNTEAPNLEQQFAGSEIAEEKVSSLEYAWLLQHSCHRVLSADMRDCIAEVPAALVATLVLAHFAGKTMAYDFQGGKWIRRSNFPELCSRAVLHSVPDFGEEYVFEERATIRRSLVYGSRRDIFAPVRFPVDLNPETRALRSWVELLLALPHELQSTGDEVEFIGLLHEMHVAWNYGFFDAKQGLPKELSQGTYGTQSNLFIVPVTNLVSLARRVIDGDVIKRAEELASLVSQKQRLEGLSGDGNSMDTNTEKGALHNQGKVFPPLSHVEVRNLAAVHLVEESIVKDWSALRAMLNHYGWLARRVGDYSVPEHGVIFAIVRTDGSVVGSNALGMVGGPGMVALRGSRLVQRWGKAWQTHFVQGVSATMAENKDDFENLMKGIEDRLVDDFEIPGPSIIGSH
jgi:hypothetical protein